jgi:hypothetical protein
MTNMRERGTQRRHPAAAIAAVCPSNDHRKPLSWTEQVSDSGSGSPP